MRFTRLGFTPLHIAEGFALKLATGHPDVGLDAIVQSGSDTRQGHALNPNFGVDSAMSNTRRWHQMFFADDGPVKIRALSVVREEIWLRLGGRTVCILDRVSNHFVFLGECYVHSFVNRAVDGR